ncbi:MAG: N-acetyltransferase [Firmicutes bacterium]|jgi:predicted N-acetyltransferase YhbS|nr:N-acetyltransferase [Bacillota bacterium]
MKKIIIRQEGKKDYKSVYQVVKEAFEKEEYSDKDEHNLVERLRKSQAFIEELSLVAEIEGKIVGHIMFTKIKIGSHTALALAPVSVSPDHQGLGIGSKLIIRGHEIAKELGYKAVVLLGHENYYPRFGYKKASDYKIKAPFEVPDENFMVVELIEGGLKDIEGTVEYAKEFFEK